MSNLSHDQFLNETVMPWDQLSIKLAKPISVDPQTSTLVADAGAVLTALRHAPERFKWTQKGEALNAAVKAQFPMHELIMNASDSWKHGALKDPQRQTQFSVKSQFLFDQHRGFRFLRNIVHMQHATLGPFDFLIAARSAIRFWLQRQGINISWPGKIFEGAEIYREQAILVTSPGIQVQQRGVNLSFVMRDANGNLAPTDPGACFFAVLDDPSLLEMAPIPSQL